MTLVLERFVPAFPLQLERMGPNARVTTLAQLQPQSGMILIGPPGPKGDDGIVANPDDIFDFIASFDGSLN